MTRGRKTGGRNWKPGQSGNLAGGPKLPAEYKAARQLNRIRLLQILEKYADKTLPELDILAEDTTLPVVELGIVRIMRDATNSGDVGKWEWLIGRSSIGKVKESVEISLPKPTVIERLDGTQVEYGAEIEEKE